jgi:hypothetical protein
MMPSPGHVAATQFVANQRTYEEVLIAPLREHFQLLEKHQWADSWTTQGHRMSLSGCSVCAFYDYVA